METGKEILQAICLISVEIFLIFIWCNMQFWPTETEAAAMLIIMM